VPCKISVVTRIPKANVFRFENYWVERNDFLQVVQQSWMSTTPKLDAAKNITHKFKILRSKLKHWSKQFSNLQQLIDNCNSDISALDELEDHRGLYNPEANLRRIIKQQLKTWLHYKNIYWRNRYTINRIKFGDERTKFFHGMATISYRRNSIS
jgi:hypothetical protein